MKTSNRRIILRIRQAVNSILFRGTRYFCPLCERSYRKFLPFGSPVRLNALCPGCGSLERHRLLWLILEHLWGTGKLRKGGKMLHLAPEPCLADRFNKTFDYLSADLDPRLAMKAMDVTAIQFPNESFDAIICNHVLEHIPDDGKAIAELYRVLKRGGWASIQVPIKGEFTQEDPSIRDPGERRCLYGQADHVRQYGRDFRSRLEKMGFTVFVCMKTDLSSPELVEAISVECEKEMWFGLKDNS